MKTEKMKNPIWQRISPYFLLNSLWLVVWGISYPGWFWFISNVLKSDQPILVHQLITFLIPFHVCNTFGSIISGIFYGIGKTDILALKSFLGNCIIGILYILFTNGIWFPNNIFSIATIFGIGLITGLILSSTLLLMIIRKQLLSEV